MMILILMLMFLLYLLNQVKVMKILDEIRVVPATGTKVTIRNGKLFIITNTELPSINGESHKTAFLDKKQFIHALIEHNGASKFINDKLVEEIDVKVDDSYVTKKVYNDYAVAYAASHCAFILQPVIMELGDTYDKSDGTTGTIEIDFVKFNICGVEPDESMAAALNKYAAAERDFFGF